MGSRLSSWTRARVSRDWPCLEGTRLCAQMPIFTLQRGTEAGEPFKLFIGSGQLRLPPWVGEWNGCLVVLSSGHHILNQGSSHSPLTSSTVGGLGAVL